MKKIEKVTKITDKKCASCGGDIIESFTKKYGEGNGVIGPGYHCPSWIESLGFGCNNCGCQYGEPVFIKTKADEQIVFELELYEAVTAHRITTEDLGPLLEMSPGKEEKTEIQGHTFFVRQHEEKVSEQKIPTELKDLEAGTKIFVLPSNDHPLYFSDGYKNIQLTKEKNAKKFEVKNSFVS